MIWVEAVVGASMNDFNDALAQEAERQGFVAFGVASATAAPQTVSRLRQWLAKGYHADMIWMEETEERRASPQGLWPDVRSVIMLGMSYAPSVDPRHLEDAQDIGRISVYAQGRDYHDTIKKRLKALARWMVARAPESTLKVFVDTAPVMEKPLAEAAGLGWQGKHSNLVSRDHGSWLLLGAIYTTLELPSSTPGSDRCGSCNACQDACPTAAFPAPYTVDGRRCISYLTIENKGPIPAEFREAIGNHIYGCDDCLAVCPWNKFADAGLRDPSFDPRAELAAPEIGDLLLLDDPSFRAILSGSPIKRIGRDRMVRNALIAAGNSGNADYVSQIRVLLDDPAEVVKGAAIWALSRLDRQAFLIEKSERLPNEQDPSLRQEWDAA